MYVILHYLTKKSLMISKVVIRNRKWKNDRQYKGQQKRDYKPNNYPQDTTHRINDNTNAGEYMCVWKGK